MNVQFPVLKEFSLDLRHSKFSDFRGFSHLSKFSHFRGFFSLDLCLSKFSHFRGFFSLDLRLSKLSLFRGFFSPGLCVSSLPLSLNLSSDCRNRPSRSCGDNHDMLLAHLLMIKAVIINNMIWSSKRLYNNMIIITKKSLSSSNLNPSKPSSLPLTVRTGARA